jgi:hypothetical protein
LDEFVDERDRRASTKAGGIEKTTVTSVYGYTPPHLGSSGGGGDDAESIEPRLPSGKPKDPWEIC